eukprot:5721964-Amphidinium_carterae.1
MYPGNQLPKLYSKSQELAERERRQHGFQHTLPQIMSPRSRLLQNPALLDPTMTEQHGMNPFEPIGQLGVGSAFDMTHVHDLIGATPRLTGIMPPPPHRPEIGGQGVPLTPEDLQQQPHRYMGIDTPRRDYPDFSSVPVHLTSSSQQQVDMQRIVQRRQRFDITQQEHVASRYQEEYSSAVAAMEAEAGEPSTA